MHFQCANPSRLDRYAGMYRQEYGDNEYGEVALECCILPILLCSTDSQYPELFSGNFCRRFRHTGA